MTSENIAKMIATAKRRGHSTRGNMRVTDNGNGCMLFTLYATDIVRVYRDKANRRRIKLNGGKVYGDEVMPNYWNTPTTRKNINAIAEALGFDGRISSKDGALYATSRGVRLWADDCGGMDFPFPFVS